MKGAKSVGAVMCADRMPRENLIAASCPFSHAELCWCTLLQVHAYRNMVTFTAAAAQIPKDVVLLEVGPHGVLRSPLRQCRGELPYVSVMQKGCNALDTVHEAVCELWCKGAPIMWPVANPRNLPTCKRAPSSLA